MSARFEDWDRRTLALALDEVAFGLASEDRAELLSRTDARSLAELEFAAAELSVAALAVLESPPAALTERIAADARAWLAASTASP